MKDIDFVVWQEEKYYVSQCINVNVSSFGTSMEEAIENLKEAVELYFEEEDVDFPEIHRMVVGRESINV